MKKNKGITMISLVITIIVLLIVTSITIGNGLGQLGIKRVNNLYADIESISTKVAEYYLKNGTLPVYDNLYVNNKQELEELFKKNGATEKITNVNDGDEYYVINPTKLDNLTLNYGDDYKEWTNTSTSEEIQNIYIINSVTHQIYFPHGVRSGDEYFFARFPDENEITAVELGEIEGELEVRITNIYANTLGDNKLSILANLTFEGELNNYDLNNLEYAWSEIDSEIENINLSYTKFQATSTNETSANAVISSKGLSDEVEHYYLYIRIKDKPYSVITGKLPKGYQQVEYIESTGTQYIKTNYIANEDIEVNCKYQFTANQQGDSLMFGFKSGEEKLYAEFYTNSRWYCACRNSAYRSVGNVGLTSSNSSMVQTLVLNKNTFTATGEIYAQPNGALTTDNPIEMYIFAWNNSGSVQHINKGMRIFYLRITNEEGKYVANFIPCYSKTNDKKGLYDLVEGKFYTNQGTGDDFIAGDNVY